MESRARHFLAAKKIPKVGSSLGKKDEILGRLFGTWHFALLDTRTGQMGFCVDKPKDRICKIASGMIGMINIVR